MTPIGCIGSVILDQNTSFMNFKIILLGLNILVASVYSMAENDSNDSLKTGCRFVVKLNTILDGSYLLADTNNMVIDANLFSGNQFEVNVKTPSKYRLQVTSIGYKSIDTVINVTEAILNIELKLVELATNLKEVSITVNKPVFEKTNDGTKVNVENSLLSKSSNAAELLNRVPGVSVAGNKAKVFGRGDAMIMLGGKEITYESLKSLPPSDIKSIEVITNPDARFDSKANAVIIVTMKKHFNQGLGGTIVEALTLGIRKKEPLEKYPLNAPNANLQFRKGNWDYNFYYANELGKSFSENNYVTKVAASEGIYTKNAYYTEDNINKQVHYYKVGMGYKITPRSSVSAQYDGLSHDFALDINQNSTYNSPLGNSSTIDMKNNASTKLLNHSFNLNYQTEIDSAGSYWFSGTQYNRFKNGLMDRITETIIDSSYKYTGNRINDGVNTIELYTLQSDLVKKLNKGQLQAGLKYSYSVNQGKVDFYSKADSENDFVLNTSYSNSNIYKENVPALYVTGTRKIKKMNLSTGLRWEHTIAYGKTRKTNTTLINMSYSSLFPSAKVTYRVNDKWTMNINYSRKINRPLYQDLDPFLWYLDSLTSIQGNPKLQPEFFNQSEIRVSRNRITVRYSFTQANNSIAQVMKTGYAGVNSVIFTKDNIQKKQISTAALEIPFEKNNYSSYSTLAINLFQFKDKREQYKVLKSEPQVYLYTYHSYKIGKLFTAEFTGEYYGGSFDGFTRKKPFYYLTIGVSRNFLKNENLNISLLYNDFARTALWAGTFNVNTYSNEYNQRFTTHYLRLNVSYTIPTLTKFNYSNKSVNDSEYNRIKK